MCVRDFAVYTNAEQEARQRTVEEAHQEVVARLPVLRGHGEDLHEDDGEQRVVETRRSVEPGQRVQGPRRI